ncbi:MAG: DUF1573 domain-containing protein [Sedimentisphaerales bacterium]|nr:DUF1573 domain-containing protein [Sedimentisphaerales bacterium]
MKNNKLLISSVLGIIFVLVATYFSISLSSPAYEINVSSTDVNLGTFNALLTKETVVTLENKGKDTFIINNIIVDCGCINVTTQSDKIPPKGKMDIIIGARQIKQGKLSHEVVIIPKDKENYEPLKISVTGNVIEPISVNAGWFGQDMKEYDPNNLLELDLINKLSAIPVISIGTNNKELKLNKIVPDVNSPNFELEKYTSAKLSNDNKDQNIERMLLTLKPKDSIKTGSLRENIKVELAEDLLLYIPIKSRIVDNAYVIEQRISFGTLSNSENSEIKVHFANNVKAWKEVKWSVEGDLSDVIDVSINKSKSTDTIIVVDLIVKKDLLGNIPKGYNFSRLHLYQNDSQDDNAISLLIDGYN